MSKIPDPEDSWAKVELFRWQHGELPTSDDDRTIDKKEAILGIAKGIEHAFKEKNTSLMITPFNLAIVLRYLAKDYETDSK